MDQKPIYVSGWFVQLFITALLATLTTAELSSTEKTEIEPEFEDDLSSLFEDIKINYQIYYQLKLDEPKLFNMESLTSRSAFIIITGSTENFDFQTLLMPYVNIHTPLLVKQQRPFFSNVTKSLLISVTKSVNHLLLIHGIDRICLQSDLLDWNRPLERIPIYPQVMVVLKPTDSTCSTETMAMENHILSGLLKLNAQPMIYILEYGYDPMEMELAPTAKKPEAVFNGFAFCQFCIGKHLQRFPVNRGDKRFVNMKHVRFSWTWSTVTEKMNRVQSYVSGNGRFLAWGFPRAVTPWMNSITLGYGDEFACPHPVRKLIRCQQKLEIVTFKVLFPLRNESEIGPEEDLRQLMYTKNDALGSLSVIIDYKKLNDDEVIFITSEGVRTEEDSPTGVYVGVFKSGVWMTLGCAVLASGLIYATTLVTLNDNFMRHSNTKRTESKYIEGTVVAKSFLSAVHYILFALLDQFPNKSPQVKYRELNFRLGRLMILPWVVATLILTNWYRGLITSSFSFGFPYELEATTWRDFENFSIYGFMPREFRGTWTKREYNVRYRGEYNLPHRRQHLLWDLYDFSKEYGSNINFTYTNFVHAEIEFLLTRILRFGETEHGYPLLAWFANKREQGGKPTERQMVQKMIYRMDLIMPDELQNYTGTAYKKQVEKCREEGIGIIKAVGSKDLRHLRYKSEDIMKITTTFYWMVRKTKTVFVVSRSDFPWYWNLFKKLMKEDSTLKFAHTGPNELKHMRRDEGLGGNGFEPPIHIRGPTFSYLKESESMLRRFQALAESGLLGLFAKWDKILYPPLDEPAHEVIPDVLTKVESLDVTDPSVQAIFKLLFIGVTIGAIVVVAEKGVHWFCNQKTIYQQP